MNRLLLLASCLGLAAAAQPGPLVAGDVPFALVAQVPRPRTPHKTVVHPPGAKAKVKTKTRATAAAAGPAVYYCASGNTVKYHASAACRGLARCNATVVPLPLATAPQSMQPCSPASSAIEAAGLGTPCFPMA
jgi:hypothetical protein